MRFRSVLVYSTLLGSVAVGAATAGLDSAAVRSSLFRWSEAACERLGVDLCLHVASGAEVRSGQVASHARLWTDPPARDVPVAAPGRWRDGDRAHADGRPPDVATTGGLPPAESALGDPAATAVGQGDGAMPPLSDLAAPSMQSATEEPQPASAPARPVVSSLGTTRLDGPEPDGQLTLGPADGPTEKATDEGVEAMIPGPSLAPAVTHSSPPVDLVPDLSPVPFPPMRPETPMQANLADPPSRPAGGAGPADRSDGPDMNPKAEEGKVEEGNGGQPHDRRRPARRMTGLSGPPPATSQGAARSSRILARTGRDPGPDRALRPRRPLQLPARLLPDDLP